ncbi:MAG: SpoVR family protein [Clostridia bacterium]|jgi:stage V sporulation protein R|nr:SpoVR family protein [Clostridia bacterium]MDH7573055.1 SpoVR family protein [Clostridia bacterium]
MDLGLEHLRRAVEEVGAAAHELGLDCGEMQFELVSPKAFPAPAAGGFFFPFPHWSFGQAYYLLRARHRYRFERTYELILPTRPATAYIIESARVQALAAVAHAVAHADFFRHNRHFRFPPAPKPEVLAAQAAWLRRCERRYGAGTVERLLDAALALLPHVHPSGRDDLLALVARCGPGLADWQREVVELARRQGLHLRPLILTRLANEGWATYWHTRIMRRLTLSGEEAVEWARLQARLLCPRPPGLNPYLVGLRLFETVAEREDREGLFRVREAADDASLAERYLTPELVAELDLFVYRAEGGRWVVSAAAGEWEEVRRVLVRELAGGGIPRLSVADADYRGRQELYLRHLYDGRVLAAGSVERALRHLRLLWGRPVHLETVAPEGRVVYTYDGDKLEVALVRGERPAGKGGEAWNYHPI